MARLPLILTLLCLTALPAQAGRRGCFANPAASSTAVAAEACSWKRVRMLDPAYGRVVWRRVRVCG